MTGSDTRLVGRLTGPLGAPVLNAPSAYTDTGQGVDVSIGQYAYRLAISDQTPYMRESADYKREQIDNSGLPGDQALTGWWAHGQLSFHMGAGLKYYEVAEGEIILNRYWDSQSAVVRDIGQVTIQPNQRSWGTFGAATNITWAGMVGGADPVILDNGVLKAGTEGTSYTPTAGTVSCAAAGPRYAYMGTTGNNIERWGVGPNAGGSSGVIYTSPNAIQNIWYAKDRLWILDSANQLYQVTPNPGGPPGALPAGGLVFVAPDGWGGNWSLCDTPGPVLMANADRIYQITVDSNGSVPSIAAPVQIAQLPGGEQVLGMCFNLGYLVVLTTRGVRVCEFDINLNLTYGPLLNEQQPAYAQTFPTNPTLSAVGNCVYVPMDGKVYEVNLERRFSYNLRFGTTLLQFALSPAGLNFDPGSMNYGCLPVPNLSGQTSPGTWANGTLPKQQGTDYATDCFIQSSYLRFDTLEPKVFVSVHVKVDGVAGSVQVSRVDENGVVTPLDTIDVSQANSADIPMALPLPQEKLAMRFTLTPSGGHTPILVGFMVRALPAPSNRQRMITLPLMIEDVESRTSAPEQGYAGFGWQKQLNLEMLEETGAIVTFQDFRTDETRTCQVDKIQHVGMTPRDRRDTGFGGISNVVLRVF